MKYFYTKPFYDLTITSIEIEEFHILLKNFQLKYFYGVL